jgi:hypothetical protein
MARLLIKASGVRISAWTEEFSVLRNVQTGSGAHSASYSTGTEVFLGDKAAGAFRLITPSNAKVKNALSYTSTHPICLQGHLCLLWKYTG